MTLQTVEQAPKLLTPQEAAKFLGLSAVSLARWRSTRVGQQIPYHKAGRIVRYDMRDLMAWLADHRVEV